MSYRNVLLSIVILSIFNISSIFANECNNDFILTNAKISVEDSSFSQSYDGNHGIILEVSYSENSGRYSLWQTSNLPTTTSQGRMYSNSGFFSLDSNFNSNRNNMLVLSPSFFDNLTFHVSSTVKNIGSCRRNGISEIEADNSKIRYYGLNDYSAIKEPNTKEDRIEITNIDFEEEMSINYTLDFKELRNYGKVYFNVGPRPMQNIILFVYIDGNSVTCGDGYYDYREICESDLWPNFTCTDNCRDFVSICGNGIEENRIASRPSPNFYWRSFFRNESSSFQNPAEVCDPGLNQVGVYNCSSNCQQRFAICGNGILEQNFKITNRLLYNNRYLTSTYNFANPEQCDDSNLDNGDGCSSTCEIEPACGNNVCESSESNINDSSGFYCPSDCYTKPRIYWENYDPLFLGNNITPGTNITLQYRVENDDSSSKRIRLDSKLRNFYLNDKHGNENYKWFKTEELSSWHRDYDYKQKIVTVPGESVFYFNHTITPDVIYQEEIDVTGIIYFYENFRYQQEGQTRWYESDIQRQSWMGEYRNNELRGQKNDWRDRDYLGEIGTIGSFSETYCIIDLKPNNLIPILGTNEFGIPTAAITYYGGYPQSNWQDEVKPNTFYLNASLYVIESNGDLSLISNRKVFLNETLDTNHNTWDKIPLFRLINEMDRIEERISFELSNFENINGKSLQFKVVPIINETNRPCISPSNTHFSNEFSAELYNIVIDVDNPIEIYPNGAGSFNELVQRIVIFNYEEFTHLDATVNIEIQKNDVISNDFEINYTQNPLLPAQSSYPIDMKIKYVGPPVSGSQKDYVLKISVTYIDPNNPDPNTNLREEFAISDIILNPQSISNSDQFIDLVVQNIYFTPLEYQENSNVELEILNQGTLPSGPFNTGFYSKLFSEINYDNIGIRRISNLNPGESVIIPFPFVPQVLDKINLLGVVDIDNEVDESNNLDFNTEENNFLSSIALVRDIDVFLENVVIQYDKAVGGVIPIKIYASNKGFGGIDSYEMIVKLQDETNTYVQSRFFTQIPEEGREEIFLLNTSEMESGSYQFTVELVAPFDQDLNDNSYVSVIDFCPTPWFNGPLSCNSYCTESCLHPSSNRYLATCHTINGCFFKDEELADACNGFTEGTYVPLINPDNTINTTHEIQCHEGIKIQKKRVTEEDLLITDNCRELIVNQFPGIFNNLEILVNIVECVDPLDS